MKLIKNKIWMFFAFALAFTACHDFPVDEDGLLITTRNECYVSNFDLLDTDNNTVKVGEAYIDTLGMVTGSLVLLKNNWANESLRILLCYLIPPYAIL